MPMPRISNPRFTWEAHPDGITLDFPVNVIVRIVIVIIENECPLLANVGAGLARPYAPTWMFFGQADPPLQVIG